MRAISKSDLALGSHINKDDLQGRERSWTTTDVRPRVGPATPSRPSTAGAKVPSTTIDIIQTGPTPTEKEDSPLKKATPPSPVSFTQNEHPRQETLQSRRRCSSSPLKIDAKTAQEKALVKRSQDDMTRASPTATSPRQPRQRSTSRPRKPTTPTKDQTSASHKVPSPNTNPTISVVPASETPFASFLSVSSNGSQDTGDNNPPPPPAPVPALPSAVSLHNSIVARAKEDQVRYGDTSPINQQPPAELANPAATRSNAAPTPVERRLGLGTGNQNSFGYESVRSFNEEKGGDKSWRMLGMDADNSPPTAKSGKSKLGGIFSRLKR